MWKGPAKTTTKIRVFQTVQGIVNYHLSLINKEQLVELLDILCLVGLADSAKLVYQAYVTMDEEKAKEAKKDKGKKEKGGKKPGAKKKEKEPKKGKQKTEEEPEEEAPTASSLEDIWNDLVEDFDLDDEDKVNAPRTPENSAVRFQMAHMGHLLQPEVIGDKDERVSFIPDDWQRELLDAVDRNESALICAPTSSGKTFISYYCIEKVLSASETDIVVYVAPTKSLVNQVAADVYFRFGNRKYSLQGRSVYGVFTEDFNYNDKICQVLITVPVILESLLLSPANEAWAKRIKYAIFDEVHCISETEGGNIWERLLQLIQCP